MRVSSEGGESEVSHRKFFVFLAIPHEKELLKRFDTEQFTIVGVDGDRKRTVALEAVAEHGISWRSFQVKKEDG